MSIDLNLFANKLQRLCAQFECDASELNVNTGISIVRLEAFLTSSTVPTGDEILILSDYFKCDYRFFISNELTASFEQTEELFRRNSSILSKVDRWNIQEFLFLCESQNFLHEILECPKKSIFSFKKSGIYFKRHAEDAARELRIHFGYKPTTAIQDIFQILRDLNINLFRRQLGNNAISGVYIKHPVAGQCVMINYNEDMFRQRFSVSHELGHAILDDDLDFGISIENQKDLSETRANTFASRLLVPPELVQTISQKTSWTDEAILSWAKKLMINPEVLAYALHSEKIISNDESERFRNIKIPKTEKHDQELPESLSENGRVRKEILLKRGLSDYYVNLCFDAYDRRLITRGRLMEMLLLSDVSLEDMCALYGRSLEYGD